MVKVLDAARNRIIVPVESPLMELVDPACMVPEIRIAGLDRTWAMSL